MHSFMKPTAFTGAGWATYPPIIFGEAVRFDTPDGFDPRLFVTYTALPRFVCELEEVSDPLPVAPGSAGSAGYWVNEAYGRAWVSPVGFIARRFMFFDGGDGDSRVLEGALEQITVAYWIWCEEYGLR